MARYDARILDGRHDPRLPIPKITGWEWYDKEQLHSTFSFVNDKGSEYQTLIHEWRAYKEWLRLNAPNEWAEQRKRQIEKLRATAASYGLHDTSGKVMGGNGCRTMTPTELDGKKAKSLRFDNVDCEQLEKNLELFEKALESTADMTADEHMNVFKRLHDVIE